MRERNKHVLHATQTLLKVFLTQQRDIIKFVNMCMLTMKNRDKLKDIEDTTENLTDSEKADNENKNGCNVELSLCPCSWGGVEKCFLFDSSVNEEVEHHEGGEWDEVQ